MAKSEAVVKGEGLGARLSVWDTSTSHCRGNFMGANHHPETASVQIGRGSVNWQLRIGLVPSINTYVATYGRSCVEQGRHGHGKHM